LSTVRVYKVAELLDTTSQEVLALLKKNHGIELKSASSTLEEIVARQFVERLAKQRNIALPKGDIFSEQAVKQAKTASKAKTAPGKKGAAAPAPEPPKPAAPTLGPPRLIKKPTLVKPAEPKVEEPAPVETPPASEEIPTVVEAPASAAEAPAAVTEPTPAEPAAAASAESAASEAAREKAGRFVPPSIRLRVEEPGKAPPSAPPLQPKRQIVPQPPRVVPPAPPRPPQAATGNLARPQGQRPYGSPRPPQSNTAAMLGGPRPLPSQPVRPSTGLPPRPGPA
jgi:hypothetical protein